MRLERITIANFKGLRDAQFEPTRFSCLVGENNAGKSTVLQAIVTALNRPTQLPRSLFYDETLPVVFTLRFVEVSGGDLQRLADEQLEKNEAGGEVLRLASKVASSWRDIRCGQIMRQTAIF